MNQLSKRPFCRCQKPYLKNLVPNKGFTEVDTLLKIQGSYFTDNLQLFVGESEASFHRFDHDEMLFGTEASV